MKRLIALAGGLIAAQAALCARPMIIHESQRIDQPAGYDYFAYSLGLDGDWAIVQAHKYDHCCSEPQTDYALLYRRSGTQWVFDRVLYTDRTDANSSWTGDRIAMSNGLIALEYNPLVIFKRNGSTFTQLTNPFSATPGTPDWVNGFVKWSGNTLFGGRGMCVGGGQSWGGITATLKTDGTWTTPERLDSSDAYCDEEPITFDFDGSSVSIATWSNDFEVGPDKVHVYKHNASGWYESWNVDGGNGYAAVNGNDVFAYQNNPDGTRVYRNDGSGAVTQNLRAVAGGAYLPYTHDGDLLIAAGDVFKRNASGHYDHVAVLLPKGVDSFGDEWAMSGRRVLSNGYHDRTSANPAVYSFDLPETFVPSISEHFSFENGNAGAWTPSGGQFAVVTNGGNHVYRQSSLAGDARSILSTYDWADQSIEADITPTAFSGSDRWTGLAVRYTDANNHYYVTLRSSGVIELRKKVAGTVSTLARMNTPVTAGKHFRVGLQAIGANIFVTLNGAMVLYSDSETSLSHGYAALVGYRTQADYDNVVVSEIRSTIYDLFHACHTTDLQYDNEWTRTGSGQWACNGLGSGTGHALTQTSTAGDARAMVGTPTDDEIVSARARVTAFGTSGTQDKWFGLAARYTDAGNYYYVSVRNSNTVSLRKLVNGAITILGTAPLPVTPGTWYDLRLDAIGDELRVFVNGAQVLQATDSTHPEGQVGALTYRAAAEYENFLAWQP